MHLITEEQFFEQYKPNLNPLKINDDEDEELDRDDLDNCKIGYGDDESNALLQSTFEKSPNHLWTILDCDGEIVIASGFHFANRMDHLITEIPYTTDVNAKEPVSKKKVVLAIQFEETVSEEEADAIVDDIFDEVHDKQYIVSRSAEITKLISFNTHLGLRVDSKSLFNDDSSYLFDMTLTFYEDDVASDKKFILLVEKCIQDLNKDHHAVIHQFTLKVNNIPKVYTGNNCPHCGSDNIEGEHLEADGPSAFSNVTCKDCHAEWKEVYELVGYEPI